MFRESISTWKFEDDITDLSREQIKEIYKEKFCKQCFQELPFSESSSGTFGHLKNGDEQKDTNL